ncbi:MAG: rRNA maturation RNase YbeY [Elusimicrobiota bacterium]|jgi:probable rRNA maturation factor|nr:rRNA maturation RNase YbeY [Elusimicrobiota bacterium]
MNNPNKQIITFTGFNKENIPVLKKAALLTLESEKKKEFEINFILISDEDIKKLNSKYRKVRRITDVISFLIVEELLIGDIYIARARSKKQAKEFNHTWQNELAYLVIHGVLHLCGYSDYTVKNRKIMFNKQEGICKCLFC